MSLPVSTKYLEQTWQKCSCITFKHLFGQLSLASSEPRAIGPSFQVQDHTCTDPSVHYSTRFLSNSCQNPYYDRTILHMLHMYICNHLHMYHVKIAQRTCGGALSLSGQCSSAPWHHGSVDFHWRYISDR